MCMIPLAQVPYVVARVVVVVNDRSGLVPSGTLLVRVKGWSRVHTLSNWRSEEQQLQQQVGAGGLDPLLKSLFSVH